VANARAGLLVPLALACASAALGCANAAPPLPAGLAPEPALGDSLEQLLVKLPHADEAGSRVALDELRVLAVDREPWTSLEPAHAAAAAGRVAVVAGRRCSARAGLRVTRAERASWFLLAGGALVAFDHDGFSGACAARARYEPAPRADVPVERMLVRYVTQRWPDDAVPPETRLPRGRKLIARGRPDDARAELHALDREIAALERRAGDPDLGEAAAREAWREEAERLRPLRAALHHALREPGAGGGALP
jgi:hypothetical protein